MSEEKSNSDKAIFLELKVYMHCKACERSVMEALKRIKGIETVKVDMNLHKAIVTGQFEPRKVLKKLKKKTGKRAEIMKKNEANNKGEEEKMEPVLQNGDNLVMDQNNTMNNDFDENMMTNFNMFNDENANACRMM
ncbi:heavy metal-associated isoprenylated plant protein 19-like [Typha latifolia]|uniref:heavy metal-associated isoprenylated plant protein 19-like n=1 Tax=Typha latifolia TaxID=4733 RepID=UPI003C2FAE3B